MNGRNTLGLTVLLLILGLPSLSFLPRRQGQLTCPRIAKNNRPALLFVEGSAAASRLCVAYMDGGAICREPIISGKYLEVTQLDNSVFLISTSETVWIGKKYAMDLESGTIRLIAETTRLRCLRAEPTRKTAMLIDVNGFIGEVRLLELGLASLATEERQMLSGALIGDEFSRIGHPFKISPDFRHIAYMSNKGGNPGERISGYELKSLDLQTLEAVVLDGNVQVEIPSISSLSDGMPPFEWISDHQVLYQDMIVQDKAGRTDELKDWVLNPLNLDRLAVFKTVDIRTGEISERFRKQLRMELNGGSLETDPLTGCLIFNRNYVLDYEKNELIDRNLPFAVSSDPAQRRIEIRSRVDVLYSGKAICMETRLSASGRYFAYLLSPEGNLGPSELYAIFETALKPIKVAEGPYSPTRPIGWIE